MNSRRNLKSTARAEEALRRSHLVDAPGLIQLIHEVNPSGRELLPAEEQRRYRLKSQLQSLLIRRFREHLNVERLDAIDVVGLRYRPHDRDACHAVVSELDEDARTSLCRHPHIVKRCHAAVKSGKRASRRRRERRPTYGRCDTPPTPSGPACAQDGFHTLSNQELS